MRTKVHIKSTSAIFAWRALQNCAMADFEENVEEIVGRLEKRRVATEYGGDETADETGSPGGPCCSGDEIGDKTAATAGDE